MTGASSTGFDLPKLHKNGTYALVTLALLSLWTGGAFAPAIGVGLALALIVSWFWERPRIDPDRFGRWWTALTVCVIGLLVYLLGFTSMGVVQVGVYLILYLTTAKLFQRSRLDDDLQLLALSFLLMAAATAFNEDLLFGLLFALYVLIGVVIFAVYHLRRQLEENARRGGRRVKNLFGVGYLSLLTAMAVVCFAASVAFFFLFPRLGFGFFAQKSREGLQMSGFSESVDLGSHGTIKTDNTVVMRVQFPEGRPKQDGPLYWRGISFDHYDGVGWSAAEMRETRSLPPDSASNYNLRRYSGGPEELVRQDIYLEPINSNVIFTLHPAITVSLADKDKGVPVFIRNRGFSIDEGGVLRYHGAGKIGVQYAAESWGGPFPTADMRTWARLEGRDRLPTRIHGAYTQLPEANPRVRRLAEQITAGLDNDYDRTVAIVDHLRQNYAYTTTLPDPGAEPPLDAFLFTHKRGHCEFFSTALVILLRSIGIPARSVNGFMGGKWNEYDDFLAVRNADAHSWAEVWFGPYDWVGFDATPPAADVSDQEAFMDGVVRLYDSLKFRWIKYVIEYDLETQVELIRQATSALGGGEEDQVDPMDFQMSLLELFESLRRNVVPALLIALLAVVAWIGLRIRGAARLDWRDGLVIASTLVGSLSIAVLMWRPEADWLARTYALAAPLYGVAWGLGGRLRPRLKGRVSHEGIARLYTRLRGALTASGIDHGPAEGPEALLARLEAADLPARGASAALIRRYMDVRFGGQPIEADELKALDRSLKDILRALRKAR